MKSIYLFVLAFLTILSANAQNAEDLHADVLHDYFGFQLELIRETPGFTPPVASRALGYSGLFAYESVVHGFSGRTSLAGILPQLSTLPAPEQGLDIYWPEVANIVLHDATAAFYPNMSADRLTQLEAMRIAHTAQHVVDAGAMNLAATTNFAEALSTALMAYADTDGQLNCQASNFPADYIAPVGLGLWAPLPGQMALQPYWGDKRCFVVEFVDETLIAPAPPAFSSEFGSEMYEEALAVYNASLNLTAEQTIIAEYWADGGGTVTPPGHSISMLKQILELEESNLAFSAEAYARLGMAVADAFVQCWKTKYSYNLERPITYIRSYIDEDWNSTIGTPPFPEYTSGHSSQSGAFGAVMTELFGDNYAFTDNTHGDQFGGPRSFNNFIECAEETAVSRLYGGIHYPIGNTMGSESGANIGTLVNELFDQTVLSASAGRELITFDIFPNPSNGQITIAGPFSTDQYITVFDLTGKNVYQSVFRNQLDLTFLNAGLYVVSVSNHQGAQLGNQRVVVR